MRILLDHPVEVTESTEYAVAVRIPQGDGKQGPGDGPALGANAPVSPNRSFLAGGAAGKLTPIAVDLVINLLTQGGPGKAAPSSPPTDAAATLPLRTYLRAGPSPTRAPAIEFGLERAKHVTLSIYDVAGRRVRTLVHEQLAAGVYPQRWDGRDQQGWSVAAGVYIVRLHADGTDITRKLVLAR